MLSKGRIGVGVLVLLMLFGLLGTSVTLAQQPVELTVSVWGMPWEDKLYTDYAIPQFEEMYPHIKVRFVRFEDYGNQLLIRHAGGTAPDVMRNGDEGYGDLRIRGALIPVTPFVNQNNYDLSDFHEIVIDTLTIDGDLWALPQDLSPRNLLYYNKTMFDEAGISYPTPEWTLDDFINAAKKLTIGQRPRIQQYGLSWGESSFFVSTMLGFGGQIWDENGRSTFSDPKNVEGIKWIQSLVYDHGVAPNYLEVDPGNTLELFKGERSAMHIDGGWSIPSVARDVPDLDFGVTLLPQPLKTILGQCIWTISSQTKHPEEAWLLTEFLSSFEVLKEYWQLTWVAAPARLSIISSDLFQDVIGVPGHVPGIEDPARKQDLIGFWDNLIENNMFTQDHINAYYDVLRTNFMDPRADDLFGGTPGNVEKILKEIEDGINREIDEF